MTAIALHSLTSRPRAVVATFVAVLLGTALMASFATLVESAVDAHDDDRELLLTIGGIVGGWSGLVVLFAVASTVGIVAEQRAREAALLRTLGATPRQARALIVYEAMLVAIVAALAGALVASVGGRALFDALRRGELITSATGYGGGPASLAAAAGTVVLLGAVAALIASRRATRGPAALAVRQVEAPAPRLRWWRVLIGVLLLASGVGQAVLTLTVTGKADEAYPAMQTAGSAAIVVSMGLATLAPALLRGLVKPLRRLLAGAGGRRGLAGERAGARHLAGENLTRRAHLLAGTLAPVIVFVATAVGTPLMIGIDSRTLAAAGDPEDVGGTITMINSVIIGMICLFAAIMVVNATSAVTGNRRAELERLWRIGATRRQLRSTVVVEAGVVAAVGVTLGLLASTATAVSYAVVRHEGVVPDGQLWLIPLAAAIATLLAVGTALQTARTVLRTVGAQRAPAR